MGRRRDTDVIPFHHMYMPPLPTSPRVERVIPAETEGLTADSARARKLDMSTSSPTIAKSHL